uniref:Interleukin 12 receptor, beta 2a n=1 Tax=Acanthochromis polyacanthus TaxID=80966 RepID=A0A3Q1GX05_9TELE
MATMFLSWSVFIAVTVLAAQLCIGEKSCHIKSTAGSVVQLGSSFTVYCTFNCKCKGSMYCDDPTTLQTHKDVNSTTISVDVVNITKSRTYSCRCECFSQLDPCGLDILAGYPPDLPKNFKCTYEVQKNESGVLVCTWNRGWDTYLGTRSKLRVRTVTGNHTDGPHSVSSTGTESLSASFALSRSVQLISVWVEVNNSLGFVKSSISNYSLSDIAMPLAPGLYLQECLSRKCLIEVKEPVETQHVQIQYTADQQTWTSSLNSVVQMNSSWSVSSLEPYRLYYFRARSKFSTGIWSEWSANISSWTQEEAPAEELDVWFTEPESDSTSTTVYWKEPNMSVSRGKIIGYKVGVGRPNLRAYNISADARSFSVPSCADCEVTVWARNSKGLSPPARVTTRRTKVKPTADVSVSTGNYSITISWRKAETAPLPAGYVVEWYPEGRQLQELRWVKLDKNENQTVISGIKAFECYEAAVYVFYNENSVSQTRFKGVATLESAPAAGPVVKDKVEGNEVKITWTELHWSQRRGCISTYSIYLEDSSGHRKTYSVASQERTYTIKGLSPGLYSVSMSASTSTGEGPTGEKVKFFIDQEAHSSLLLVCGILSVIVLFLVCLCQSSAVKQRFFEFFQCFMLDVVPDPANSKWAKEYTQDKDKMSLMPQQSNSSASTEEEEPILVDVEELPKQSSAVSMQTNVSSPLPPQTDLNPGTDPATLLYPLTTYIKSFSHDSDSSDQTQTSLDTNSTVDYISSHGPGNLGEEDEEEEEEEFADMNFFPSHNIFLDSLEFGGKLTLDAVKIDCSDFFQSA